MQTPAAPASATRGFSLILFGGLFTAMPLFALYRGIQRENIGGLQDIGGMLFFLAIGLGVVVTGLSMVWRAGRASRLLERYPDQPWMLHADWASGKVREGSRRQTLFICVFAVFWNTVSWVILLGFLRRKTVSFDVGAIVISLFVLIGLVAAVVALYRLLRWRKYGTSVFELAQVPGVVGGSLGGVVLIRAKLEPQNGFNVRLRCIHRRVTGRGKHRSVHTETLWEREQLRVQAQHNLGGVGAIPVLFTIPYECRPTQTISANENYYWELLVSAKTVGIDYKAVFHVPVYRTGDSSPAVRDGVENLPQEEQDALGLDVRSVEGLRLTQTQSGGERMDFKKLPNGSGMFVGFAIAGAAILGILSLLWNADLPKLFLGVFIIAGVLLLWVSLSALLTGVHLVLYPDRVEVVRRVLGILLAPQIIAREQVKRIDLVQGVQIHSEVYYDLVIHTEQGKKVRIAARLRGQTQAELVRNHVRQRE